MWKKDDDTGAAQKPSSTPRPEAAPRRTAPAGGEPATIGPSITIKGEVSGDEDLLIEGRVDGSVDLKEQAVTVGSEGRVKADITGRVVTVEGEVEGDLKAKEQIILRSSAKVEGDISAPRVVLEDGARFRGLVDMGEATDEERGSSRTSSGSSSSTSKGRSGGKDEDDDGGKDDGATKSARSGTGGAADASDKPGTAKAATGSAS